jgi:hypothetical protein
MKDKLPIQPDYACRTHVVDNPETIYWIHYMSHELVGLSNEELERYYYSMDPSLRDII